MSRFRLCYVNKSMDDNMPYYAFMYGEDKMSLDDIWKRAHRFYDLGAIVNIMDTTRWIDKTFYK